MNFQAPRSKRMFSRTLVGRFRGGKLAPVYAEVVRGSEGGMISQSVTFELDRIAGRLITPITAEVISVFVPVQAIDAIKDPEAAYAGMTEVVREKLLSGNPLFGLENEGEISKRCGVNPRSVGGAKKVNEAVRLAHNAAINFLRLSKYHKATLLLHSNTAITPALISQTVLERLNGVLDPDDRINGAFNVSMPDMVLPVTGVRPVSGITQSNNDNAGGGTASHSATATDIVIKNSGAFGSGDLRFKRKSGNPIGTQLDINVDLAGATAALNGAVSSNLSLNDFYNAQSMDRLIREMDGIVKDNPVYGYEMVARWAHGLSVDAGKTPFVIAQQRRLFGRDIVTASDKPGIEADLMRSDMLTQISFTVPVPKTELGGVIITFASVKPDENIASQPHPFLSDVWGLDNFVADELKIDPVPVTIRDLDSDCLSAQESTVALYTGYNELKRRYVSYGFNRHVDLDTVENKTAVWQLNVPLSVTPNTILYPENLSHYPFSNQLAEVCSYSVTSNLNVLSPMIVGPTPVETVEVATDLDLFDTV